MRRAVRVAIVAAVALGATAAPAAAAVFVRSAGGRIDIADDGGSVIRYGVSAGQFLLYASPAPTPSAACTTTADPTTVSCPMAGVALVNFALGTGSSLDRAVGDSGPPISLDVNVSGAGGDSISLDGGRNTVNVRNGQPDTVDCRNGGPNLRASIRAWTRSAPSATRRRPLRPPPRRRRRRRRCRRSAR